MGSASAARWAYERQVADGAPVVWTRVGEVPMTQPGGMSRPCHNSRAMADAEQGQAPTAERLQILIPIRNDWAALENLIADIDRALSSRNYPQRKKRSGESGAGGVRPRRPFDCSVLDSTSTKAAKPEG